MAVKQEKLTLWYLSPQRLRWSWRETLLLFSWGEEELPQQDISPLCSWKGTVIYSNRIKLTHYAKIYAAHSINYWNVNINSLLLSMHKSNNHFMFCSGVKIKTQNLSEVWSISEVSEKPSKPFPLFFHPAWERCVRWTTPVTRWLKLQASSPHTLPTMDPSPSKLKTPHLSTWELFSLSLVSNRTAKQQSQKNWPMLWC